VQRLTRADSAVGIDNHTQKSLRFCARHLIICANMAVPVSIAKDYSVRAAALEGFLPLMRELGIDGIALLVRAGLNAVVDL
jgi:hypothetical protein